MSVHNPDSDRIFVKSRRIPIGLDCRIESPRCPIRMDRRGYFLVAFSFSFYIFLKLNIFFFSDLRSSSSSQVNQFDNEIDRIQQWD
jgi:hypothetical protein